MFFLYVYSILFPIEQVIHSPENGREIISLIDSSHDSLSIEMYLLTDDDAVESIIRAHSRGVNVRVILEKNVMDYQNDDAYRTLISQGVPVVFVSKKGALTHTKMILVDGKKAYVGSHNLSKNALTKNREIGIITEHSSSISFLSSLFERDWELAYGSPSRIST